MNWAVATARTLSNKKTFMLITPNEDWSRKWGDRAILSCLRMDSCTMLINVSRLSTAFTNLLRGWDGYTTEPCTQKDIHATSYFDMRKGRSSSTVYFFKDASWPKLGIKCVNVGDHRRRETLLTRSNLVLNIKGGTLFWSKLTHNCGATLYVLLNFMLRCVLELFEHLKCTNEIA